MVALVDQLLMYLKQDTQSGLATNTKTDSLTLTAASNESNAYSAGVTLQDILNKADLFANLIDLPDFVDIMARSDSSTWLANNAITELINGTEPTKAQNAINALSDSVTGTESETNLSSLTLAENVPYSEPITSQSAANALSDSWVLVPKKIRYIRDWLGTNTLSNSHLWMEIQAFDGSDTNVALSKTVTGDISTSADLTKITDGDTTAYVNLTVDTSNHYVTVDLGALYDIKKIVTFHIGDGRYYYYSMTEVSEDGVNWYPVYDTNVEGTYYETNSGHTIDLTNLGATADPTKRNKSDMSAILSVLETMTKTDIFNITATGLSVLEDFILSNKESKSQTATLQIGGASDTIVVTGEDNTKTANLAALDSKNNAGRQTMWYYDDDYLNSFDDVDNTFDLPDNINYSDPIYSDRCNITIFKS
jgi:hypothetical protein